MTLLRNKLLLFLLIISQLLTSHSYAQEGLEHEQSYFQEMLPVYQDWLMATKINTLLKAQKITAQPDRLVLEMEIQNKDTWFDLKDTYKEKYQKDIGQRLLDKFCFQMSVGKDSALILINCIEDDYPIRLSYKDGKFFTDENLPMVSTKGMFTINLTDLPHSQSQQAKGSAIETKNLIKLYLKNYYSDKKNLLQKAKFRTIDNEDEINFEISNIKKEVLDDFLVGYYELIIIDMYFIQKGDIVEIHYELQAKYGSGIFAAPRRSGYKDMEPKYQDYVERYRKRFSAMIKEVLHAKKIKG